MSLCKNLKIRKIASSKTRQKISEVCNFVDYGQPQTTLEVWTDFDPYILPAALEMLKIFGGIDGAYAAMHAKFWDPAKAKLPLVFKQH